MLNKIRRIEDLTDSFEDFFETLSNSYETSFQSKGEENTKRRLNGIYHTPYKLSKIIVKKTIGKDKNLLEKTFLEPCLGLGSFVFAYLEEVLKDVEKITYDLLIKIEKKIYVAEWDKTAINLFVLVYKIFLRRKYHYEYPEFYTNFNISIESLVYSRKIEELSIEKSFGTSVPKFDYIMTNPPYFVLRYVNRKWYSEDEKNIIKGKINQISSIIKNKKYDFSKGKNLNIYEVFMEEIIENYSKDDTKIGLLLPYSFLTNKSTSEMRKNILRNYTVKVVQPINENTDFYPVGQSMTIFIMDKKISNIKAKLYPWITKEEDLKNIKYSIVDTHIFEQISDDCVFLNLDSEGLRLLEKIHQYHKLKHISYIINKRGEIDGTKYKDNIKKFPTEDTLNLTKGRDLNIYKFVTPRSNVLLDLESPVRKLYSKFRIACNQISNLKGQDRLKFSIAENTFLANSCNYIFCEGEDSKEITYYLMALMNSSLMEWRFRITNGNNHVSNYELDELPLNLEKDKLYYEIVEKVSLNLETEDKNLELELDELIFEKYNINYREKAYVLKELNNYKIYNHFLHKLSDLDMEVVRGVPNEGDNWQALPPATIAKSKRLQGITKTGGRTTLYARLDSTKPSYTMNTYFHRPGNGAHIHPKQDRVITSREAARFQGFPDTYKFLGSKTAISNQIGNAIPSLLSYILINEIKKSISINNAIDLFCGAGGSKIGLNMANINTLVANDINAYACLTYKYNNPEVDVLNGDITTDELKENIKNSVGKRNVDLIMGGPPCQGFSLAGKRQEDDERNELFKHFAQLVKDINPKVLIMENVPGILSMKKGEVFKEVKESFGILGYKIFAKKLLAADYGVPQKRNRVLLIGIRNDIQEKLKLVDSNIFPEPMFKMKDEKTLFSLNLPEYVSVEEAIGDLPVPETHQDKIKAFKANNKDLKPYQKLMKGIISIEEFYKEKLN